jgi:DNA-binding NarL/FixJ family response regulator
MAPKPISPQAKNPAKPAPKKVFIVDDHPVFRDGLQMIVNQVPGLIVCGEADNAAQAFDAISELDPDLVLMDINLPGEGGLELLQDVHAIKPDLPVLVISMHDETLYAERVLRAGGRGYIMKQEGPDKMTQAILKVLSGQVYASERTAEAILNALSRPRATASTSALGSLTDRELEILRLTGQGKDNRQIATDLHISLKTVDTHRGHIKEKLGLKNGTELIHYAVRWVGGQF